MAFDLKSAITSIAPTLATMLGGPLAGTAVAALEGAFGLQAGAGIDGITKVVQTGAMTPEIIASVRAADQKHAEIIGQQGIDLAKLNADTQTAGEATAAADRASARGLQIARPSFVPAILSVTMVLGFFCVLGAFLAGVKMMDNQVGLLLLGTLATAFTQVLAYWFGTTRGSSEKNTLLAQSQPAKL